MLNEQQIREIMGIVDALSRGASPASLGLSDSALTSMAMSLQQVAQSPAAATPALYHPDYSSLRSNLHARQEAMNPPEPPDLQKYGEGRQSTNIRDLTAPLHPSRDPYFNQEHATTTPGYFSGWGKITGGGYGQVQGPEATAMQRFREYKTQRGFPESWQDLRRSAERAAEEYDLAEQERLSQPTIQSEQEAFEAWERAQQNAPEAGPPSLASMAYSPTLAPSLPGPPMPAASSLVPSAMDLGAVSLPEKDFVGGFRPVGDTASFPEQSAGNITGDYTSYPTSAEGAAASTTRPFTLDPIYNPGSRTIRPHLGLDIRQPTPGAIAGEFAVAVAPGTVISVGDVGDFGNQVRVEHPDGTVSSYNHLASIGVDQGDTIEAGWPVGVIGETGNATGPHLHFEMRDSGLPTDPTDVVSGLRLMSDVAAGNTAEPLANSVAGYDPLTVGIAPQQQSPFAPPTASLDERMAAITPPDPALAPVTDFAQYYQDNPTAANAPTGVAGTAVPTVPQDRISLGTAVDPTIGGDLGIAAMQEAQAIEAMRAQPPPELTVTGAAPPAPYAEAPMTASLSPVPTADPFTTGMPALPLSETYDPLTVGITPMMQTAWDAPAPAAPISSLPAAPVTAPLPPAAPLGEPVTDFAQYYQDNPAAATPPALAPATPVASPLAAPAAPVTQVALPVPASPPLTPMASTPAAPVTAPLPPAAPLGPSAAGCCCAVYGAGTAANSHGTGGLSHFAGGHSVLCHAGAADADARRAALQSPHAGSCADRAGSTGYSTR